MPKPFFPKPLIIYRTSAACQINPDFERQIFWISFAKGLGGQPKAGQKQYEWDKKITLALSLTEATDLAAAAEAIKDSRDISLSFYHDPRKRGLKEQAKILSLNSGGEGKTLAFLGVKQGERKLVVSLGRGDLFRIEHLLVLSAAGIMGWIVRSEEK